MKCNKLVVNLLTLTLIIAPALVGCKKGPQRPTPIPGIGPGDTSGGETPSRVIPPGPGMNNVDTGVRPGNLDSNPNGTPLDPKGPKTGWPSDNGETFKAQIVYFDFDKSSVRASEKPKVEEVARRMKSEFGGKALRIQGHCDERGTEQYNLSLGERRALGVREALIQLGISPDMIETISYGEDRPQVPEHNDSAYAKNRRAVFELLTPPDATTSK